MIAKKTVLSDLISTANKNRPHHHSNFRPYPIKRKTKSPQVKLTGPQQEAVYYARQQLRQRHFQETIERVKESNRPIDIYGSEELPVVIPLLGCDPEDGIN